MNDINLLDVILSNASNKEVLNYFKLPLDRKENLWLKIPSELESKFISEGQTDFFKGYSKDVPDNFKYLLNSYGMLINPLNGEIFSVQFGFSEIAFKCDVKRSNIIDSDKLRTFSNLDGIISDIRPLGNGWALGINFVGSVEEQLLWAYELSISKQ